MSAYSLNLNAILKDILALGLLGEDRPGPGNVVLSLRDTKMQQHKYRPEGVG